MSFLQPGKPAFFTNSSWCGFYLQPMAYPTPFSVFYSNAQTADSCCQPLSVNITYDGSTPYNATVEYTYPTLSTCNSTNNKSYLLYTNNGMQPISYWQDANYAWAFNVID